jgi:hypothetical protein
MTPNPLEAALSVPRDGRLSGHRARLANVSDGSGTAVGSATLTGTSTVYSRPSNSYDGYAFHSRRLSVSLRYGQPARRTPSVRQPAGACCGAKAGPDWRDAGGCGGSPKAPMAILRWRDRCALLPALRWPPREAGRQGKAVDCRRGAAGVARRTASKRFGSELTTRSSHTNCREAVFRIVTRQQTGQQRIWQLASLPRVASTPLRSAVGRYPAPRRREIDAVGMTGCPAG